MNAFDICLAGLALYLLGCIIWRRSAPLPPGPPPWPLIGNLLDLRADVPYKAFGALSSKYGPLMSLSALGNRYIVLSSFKATKDLLEKRSAITANRPRFIVAGDIVGWTNTTGFLPYGDTHRKHRKFFGRHIRTNRSLAMFYPTEEAEAKLFVRSLMKDPDNLRVHCRRSTGSLILKISHGYSVKDDDDPLVEMADRAMRNMSEIMTPGRFIADFFPIMQYLPEWFPGGGFHKDAKLWQKMLNKAVNTPYEFVLEHLAKGDAVPSFTSQLLQEGLTLEEQEALKWSSFSMYLGMVFLPGSQNASTYFERDPAASRLKQLGRPQTPSMLGAFFLAMTLYPDVLKKGQAEIDTVIGNEKLPTMEDRDALPYVDAICTELLRWNAVIPLPSHVNTEDIIYEGYLIPKGSWLVANTWFILNDPDTYPDPDVFNPERFLGEAQQPDPREACFGWGRRLCLGSRLAESMLFAYVATALATLDVSKYVENGVELVPKYEYNEGMLRHLKPFKCSIVPRSKKAEDLVT